MIGSPVRFEFSELSFWSVNARAFNLSPFVQYPVNIPRHIVYSDASQVACVSYVCFPVAHVNFDDVEMKQSSTWRELKSVSFALRSFAPILYL